MSLEFSGSLYSGDNRTGTSYLVGVGSHQRYGTVAASELQNRGLYANIHSVDLYTTAEATANVILLQNDDYSGAFAQVSDAKGAGDAWWHSNGHIGSVLLVAGNRKGENETRLSFRDKFLSQWDSFLDSKLSGGRASREGDPTLTWEMFPTSVSHLDSHLTYLKIYQPLHIHMPWYWPDYSANMTYHVYLYLDGNRHLRAWGARWAWWVESGAKSGKIGDQLGPQVSAGLGALQDQLNQQFALVDLLGPLNDVYFLPGNQTTPLGTGGISGNTNDDITIVVAH